jgi:hypothetical protein
MPLRRYAFAPLYLYALTPSRPTPHAVTPIFPTFFPKAFFVLKKLLFLRRCKTSFAACSLENSSPDGEIGRRASFRD